jgi:hypothetical protein
MFVAKSLSAQVSLPNDQQKNEFDELTAMKNYKKYVSFNATEEHAFKNVNNCLNPNIYSYLETSGGQISNPYLNAVHFFNNRVN